MKESARVLRWPHSKPLEESPQLHFMYNSRVFYSLGGMNQSSASVTQAVHHIVKFEFDIFQYLAARLDL